VTTHDGATGPGDGSPATAEAGNDQLAPGTAMALAAMALGVFVIANDFTALNVALPAIEQDFDVDVGTVQWVINAYALTFGLAIVTGGRLADMYGRKRMFFAGAGIFAGFSALGGFAPNSEVLIAMRVGMGIGGALMWPAILGMTYAALPAKRAALAGGLILGVAGLGNAVGPMIGGALTELLSWRWIFFLNVPIAAFAISVTAAKIHQTQERTEERIDYAGMAALSIGLLCLLLALDQSTDWGFGDSRVIALLAAAVVLIVSFGVIEPRMGTRALIPVSVMRNREFMAASIAVLLMSAVFFVLVLYVPQFLIKILGYSAFEAGLGLLPMMGTFALTSYFGSKFYERLGPKRMVSAGAALLVVGTFLLSLISATDGYGSLVLGLFIVGAGVGLFYSSVTTAAVTALPESQSSLAGGIVYMCQIGGGAIGLATITTIFTATSERDLSERAADLGTRLTDHQEAVMHGLLVGTDAATAALAQLSGPVRAEIDEIVRESFVHGLNVGLTVVACLALVGLVVSVLFVGGRLGQGDQDSADPAGDEPAETSSTPS
jgi:EmrB/QacA subfamily drug resistance transporter